MCYSEFGEIIEHDRAHGRRRDLDRGVPIGMELLDAFREFDYPNEIGPGVYDIHSPRVPPVEELEQLLELAERRIGRERLWVNPDCGLKTRAWPETRAALANLVEVARRRRAERPAAEMSRILDRLPPLATTGVGSLPFERPAQAARHALDAYQLPFCPQLPRLDGDMIAEWLGADPGRCGWAPDRDRERPTAWHDVVARLTTKPPEHGLVKLQVTGPITLAIALERSAGRRLTELAGEIATWLAANLAGQIRQLGQVGLQALVVVDEPGLARAGVGPTEAALWDPLRATAGAWGCTSAGRCRGTWSTRSSST